MNSQNDKNKSVGSQDLSTEARPTIVISAEDDSFGLVSNLNLAATAALGYNKMEVINKNINNIMPHIYSVKHDTFLENYLQSLEPRILVNLS